jgi:predicted lipoprotein with Yx(FWY)xxD motif
LERFTLDTGNNTSPHTAEANKRVDEKKENRKQMLTRNKSHIKHTFRDFDMKGQPTCKFVCTTYWATQR